MSNTRKTVSVTGASQEIGAGSVQAFVARGNNVVASSRQVTGHILYLDGGAHCGRW